MKHRSALRAVCAALILLYLILAPPIIRRGLSRDPRMEYYTTPAPSWYGVVTIWHIASFRTYQGSVTDYLSARAKAFHASNPGIHIKIIGMSEEGYAQRAARGETPDGYSFAPGLLVAERLSQLRMKRPDLLEGIPAACFEGSVYALPYLLSGYALAVNTQRLYQAGLSLPAEGDESAFLREAAALSGKVAQLAASPLVAAAESVRGEPSPPSAFSDGTVLAGVIDLGTLGRLSRSADSQLLLYALPYTRLSDQLYYMGASSNTDSQRVQVIQAFLSFLLSDAEQARLSCLGAFPVTAPGDADSPSAAYAQDVLKSWYSQSQSVLCPDPFLYQRHRQALLEDANAALTGNQAQRDAFKERFFIVFGRQAVIE